MAGNKSRKKVHHEEHVDETWLIPYADMLTLLLALFIVMFAMSKADQEKLKSVSDEFKVIFSGQSAIFKESGSAAIPSPEAAEAVDPTALEEDTMNHIKEVLDQKSEEDGYSDKVEIVLDAEGLAISIQDAVLFNSGDDKLVSDSSPLLSEISNMLTGLDNNIKIVGHTDNLPISNERFRSNWDLSAMRAITVMNFLANSGNMNPEKFSIQGYGEYKPKFDNSTEAGRAKNRRVEILVIRKYQQQPDANQDKAN